MNKPLHRDDAQDCRQLGAAVRPRWISTRTVLVKLSLAALFIGLAAMPLSELGAQPAANPELANLPTAAPPSAAQQSVLQSPRELLVPFDDLHVLLGGSTRRVFMTRDEFAELMAKAHRDPVVPPPVQFAIIDAQYDATIEEGRAEVQGELKIETLAEGYHAVPLLLNAVGILSAEVDDEPALMTEDAGGVPQLILSTSGMHILRLSMAVPVTSGLAQQSLSWQLPTPPSTRIHLTVPGNVDLTSGAAVLNRRVDDQSDRTHFELLPQSGQVNLVMSLNNQRLRDETTILCRMVLIDEVTQGYERLHANLSMNILHGASDEFRFSVPDGFDISQVSTPMLARWSVSDGDGSSNASGRILTVKLRELTTERVVIQFRADRASPALDDWQMPKTLPQDVAGFSAVIGVLLEEQLSAKPIEETNLIPIDNQVLAAALPPSVLTSEPGMPRVRPLVAYYAPQSDFELATQFYKPPSQLFVTTNLLLTVAERGLELDGGFALRPESEKLFYFEFTVPEGWVVDQVQQKSDGRPLSFDRFSAGTDQGSRVRVQLPQGLQPLTTMQVGFHATSTPSNWLGDWSEQTVSLPVVTLASGNEVHESGAVAARGLDDLKLQPESAQGLIVLGDPQKSKYGYGSVTTDLAWRYSEEPWSGSLRVVRRSARSTGRAYSFFRLSQDALNAHYELTAQIDQGRTQQIRFSLPVSTPGEIAIRGLDDAIVKETRSSVADGRRHWTVQLAERKAGRLRLAVDFVQPLTSESLRGLTMPDLQIEEVIYQSGLIAVEGDPEIDVSLVRHPRTVDVGELIDAEYQVGKRLLGVFSYVGTDNETTVDVVRRVIHPLPTTIVEKAELFSTVDRSGHAQTSAQFLLRTKANYLEARLPEGATLWSVLVDGQPALPERQGDHRVIALNSVADGRLRDVRIVFEHSIARLGMRGEFELLPPSLWQRSDADADSQAVPMADMNWHVQLPAGYSLVGTGGTMSTAVLERPSPMQWLQSISSSRSHSRDISISAEMESPAEFARQPATDPFSALDSKITPSQRPIDAINEAEKKMRGVEPIASTLSKMKPDGTPQRGTRDAAEPFSDVATNGAMEGMGGAMGGGMAGGMPGGFPGMGSVELPGLGSGGSPNQSAAFGGLGFPVPDAAPSANPGLPASETLSTATGSGAGADGTVVLPAKPADESTAARTSGVANAPNSRAGRITLGLAGLRSLKIDLHAAPREESVTFTSLGVDPILRATVIDQGKFDWLGRACGLGIALIGLFWVYPRWTNRLKFCASVLLAAIIIPSLTGLELELQSIADWSMVAAVFVLAATTLGWIVRTASAPIVGSSLDASTLTTPSPATPTTNLSASSTAILCLLATCLVVGDPATLLAQNAVDPVAVPSNDSAETIPADPQPAVVRSFAELEALLAALPTPAPISIPDDAIVIPYDPETFDVSNRGDKLLVPYDRYVELKRLAQADKESSHTPSPFPFAWSSAEYRADLSDEKDSLAISGRLSIDVLADQVIAVPLHFSGAVLERFTVDGAPAQIQIVGVGPSNSASPVTAPAQQVAMPPNAQGSTLIMLYLKGKGKKDLSIDLRMKVEKRGGWQVVSGQLPAAPASKLTLVVPHAQTELRFEGFFDRATLETSMDEQEVEAALPRSGRVDWQWRGKIAQTQVDQGLSVDARGLLRVQEDAIRFVWEGVFQYRGARRESFVLKIPADYVVEWVHAGESSPTWKTEPVDQQTQLTIDLPTAVADRQVLSISIMRQHAAAIEVAAQLSIPVIEVPDAMLQQGQITIERSSLLELRTVSTSGLRRIDNSDTKPWSLPAFDASPLPLQTYQAFHYSQLPYAAELTVEPIASRTRVTTQTVLTLSQMESTLESKLILQIQDRPLHHLQLLVPGNWKLQRPESPVPYEWHVQPSDDGRQSVEFVFASGLLGNASIVLRGNYELPLGGDQSDGSTGAIPPVALPNIIVQDAESQSGEIVVTSDPAFDVRADKLEGCETALLGLADPWLAASQKPLARLLIRISTPDVDAVSGQLQLTLRTAQVRAVSITNVKLTDRAIEETILVELTIRAAGIRHLSVLMPARMAQARVRGPLIRNHTWSAVDAPVNSVDNTSVEAPVDSAGDAPIDASIDAPAGTVVDAQGDAAANGQVRLLVELQEEVMGQYSLIIENDRVLAGGEQTVPIPIVETGKTDHRFVMLENSGRDELLIGQRRGLEPLERSQSQWRTLSDLLGGKATEAFVVRESGSVPLLTFTTKDRSSVETAGGRIGIAKTTMVVDQTGAYRAVQEYRVENRTEQFLELELPAGARLWTAFVAGEPVKPMIAASSVATGAAASNNDSRVRIPLIKTAAGDLDYPVTIKYGGQIPSPGNLQTTKFPLVKTINLQVELSQVRLLLPQSQRWWNFSGTMGRVLSEQELTAGWLSFRTRQLIELSSMLRSEGDGEFYKARASENLKQLGKEVEEIQRKTSGVAQSSVELQQQLAYNNSAWIDAQQQIAANSVVDGKQAADQPTNRARLYQRLDEQDNGRSLNVANAFGNNFDISQSGDADQVVGQPGDKTNAQPTVPPSAQAGAQLGNQTGGPNREQTKFSDAWFAGNSLQNSPGAAERLVPQGQGLQTRAKGLEVDGLVPGLDAPAIAATKDLAATAAAPPPTEVADGEDRLGQISRYSQKLERKSAASKGSFALGRTEAPAAEGGEMIVGDFAVGQAPAVTPAAFLNSLDVQLPTRGVEYLFTTPGGELHIEAQSISNALLDRITAVMIAGIAGLGIYLLMQRVRSKKRFMHLATK